jgi:hypothetical protein
MGAGAQAEAMNRIREVTFGTAVAGLLQPSTMSWDN